jgi:hypothetical protein
MNEEELHATPYRLWAKGAAADAPVVQARDAAIIQAVMVALAPVIYELEQRLVEVERSQKTYLGVWKADRQYSAMSEVTCDGARWYCCKSTSNRPGTSADWTMMEKSAAASSPRSDTATVHPRNGSSHTMSRPRTP